MISGWTRSFMESELSLVYDVALLLLALSIILVCCICCMNLYLLVASWVEH